MDINIPDINIPEWFKIAVSHSLTEKEQDSWMAEAESNNIGWRLRLRFHARNYRAESSRDISDVELCRYLNGPIDGLCITADKMVDELRRKMRSDQRANRPIFAAQPF